MLRQGLKYVMNRKCIETIYSSFSRPKLEYTIQVLDSCIQRDAKLLEALPQDTARIATGA